MYAHRKTVILRVPYVERVDLGTPYTEVVDRIRRVVRSPDLGGRCHLIADATGVGMPVIDMLRRVDLGCQIFPVLITGGDLENCDGSCYRVPKRDLIIGLQAMVQRGALQIAEGMKERERLMEEMMSIRVKISGSGHERYGAWRDGEHDDLVLALALGCWGMKKVWGGDGMGDGGIWRRDGRLV